MYLTRVKLNINRRDTQLAFSMPNRFHGAVERAFIDRQERNLWRIDRLHGEYYLLLLSALKPDMSEFVRQFGDDEFPAETKDYDPLLNRILDDSVWHFRLVANPTHSIKSKSGRGKVTAHITPEHQLNWLMKKAEANGFEVDDDCIVSSNEWRSFRKNANEKKSIHMLLVSYEGVLRVKNTDQFKNALTYGIGRGKAFGGGLLTIYKA